MASLGLKIYYLRTREKKLSQTEVARALGVRQATISYIENDVTAPHFAILVRLAKFFDVTPTYLADEERSVVPRPTERWGLRDSLVTLGMWVEVDADAALDLGDGTLLCPLQPRGQFYDEEAARVRRRHARAADSRRALTALEREVARSERELEEELQGERARYARRRHRR